MTVLVVIQARTGSTRLPGKVLEDLAGRPLLRYQLDRLGRDLPIVVATSDRPRDDAVAAVATAAGVDVVRGPEEDVLGRFGRVLDAYRADTIVRLTADCPFSDPALVGAVVDAHHARGDDYTSNVLPRTFPRGLDVEVVRAGALLLALERSDDPFEREHVLPYLYRRPGEFRLGTVRSGGDLGHARWVVDTAADLATVRAMAGHFAPRVDMGWRELLAAFPIGSPPTSGPVRIRLAREDDCDFLFALRNDPEVVRTSGTGRAVGRHEHEDWFARVVDRRGLPAGDRRVRRPCRRTDAYRRRRRHRRDLDRGPRRPSA